MRLASLALLVVPASLMLFGSGCIIGECKETEPGTTCYSFEPATRYEAPAQTKTAAWTTGKAVRIQSDNGGVTVKSGSGSDVSATFSPFTLGAKDEKDKAADEMREDLELTVTDNGTEILVGVNRKSGSNGGLGSDISVTLPAGFDADFVVIQGNGTVTADLSGVTPLNTRVENNGAGSLTVKGARGQIDLHADVGDIELDVSSLGLADGTVLTENGDVTLSMPADADGTLELSADGSITESNIPSSWTSDGGSYTMNSGAGGTLSVTTEFGDIELSVR